VPTTVPAPSRASTAAELKPAALAGGERVSIVAPASPFDRDRFQRGLDALRSLGLTPAHGEGLFARHPAEHAYLAGDDQRRSEELRSALADKQSRLIVLARGGYGSMRLLHGPSPLQPDEVRADPKLLVGYSDATALHQLWAHAGVPSIHGPMCTQLGEEASALERLRALLFDTNKQSGLIVWEPQRPLGAREGRAEGVLRGGNLAVLAALCGTPLQPRFAGALVLLEDLAEPPYRLDRLVTQLILSGALEGARGFVVGDLVGPGEPDAGRAEAVAERLSSFGVPVAFGAPFGHAGRNQPVALGVPHALDAGRGSLLQLEPPCAPRARELS
jgi:muramoyltetrapeptide carboxypeptidase